MNNCMSICNKSTIVLGVCGTKMSGKDTLADMFVQKDCFKKSQIAKPLKEICKSLFHLDEDQVNSKNKDIIDERYGTTPREILQFFGTHMMQFEIQKVLNCGRNFWVNDFIGRHTGIENIIISDMRFIHEYEALKDKYKDNFKVIHVIRDTGIIDNHISETEWRDIPADYIVENNRSINDLKIQFEAIYNSLDL